MENTKNMFDSFLSHFVLFLKKTLRIYKTLNSDKKNNFYKTLGYVWFLFLKCFSQQKRELSAYLVHIF